MSARRTLRHVVLPGRTSNAIAPATTTIENHARVLSLSVAVPVFAIVHFQPWKLYTTIRFARAVSPLITERYIAWRSDPGETIPSRLEGGDHPSLVWRYERVLFLLNAGTPYIGSTEDRSRPLWR